MVCKRLNVFPKDIQYLLVEYLAEAWKQGWDRENVVKSLWYENDCLKKLLHKSLLK